MHPGTCAALMMAPGSRSTSKPGNILGHTPSEEFNVLRQITNMLAKLSLGRSFQRGAVQPNLAPRGPPDAYQHPGE